MIIQTSPAQINTGDLSVSLDPAASNTMGLDSNQITGGNSDTIAAGAYSIEVHNTGQVDITVAGYKVQPGDKWELEAKYNHVTNRHDFCPEVLVDVPAGGSAYFVAYTPSA